MLINVHSFKLLNIIEIFLQEKMCFPIFDAILKNDLILHFVNCYNTYIRNMLLDNVFLWINIFKSF